VSIVNVFISIFGVLSATCWKQDTYALIDVTHSRDSS